MNQINKIRRSFTKKLTYSLAPSKGVSIVKSAAIKKILVSRPNHRLGNQLLITPLVEELCNRFPQASIDIFVKGKISYELFKNNHQIESIISLPHQHFKHPGDYLWSWIKLNKTAYDLVINVTPDSSSGRLSTKFSKGKIKLFGDEYPELSQNYEDYSHMAKQPIYNLRKFLKIERDQIIPNLNIRLSDTELEKGKKLLSELVGKSDKVISIFTYATGIKCYPPIWWQTFYEKLKTAFPAYVILEILPVENVSQINFAASTFYSTDIREIASVIAGSTIFIGADSGMMHLASASNTCTIGLFHITSLDKYQPYNKQSMGVDTNKVNQTKLISLIQDKLERKNFFFEI